MWGVWKGAPALPRMLTSLPPQEKGPGPVDVHPVPCARRLGVGSALDLDIRPLKEGLEVSEEDGTRTRTITKQLLSPGAEHLREDDRASSGL